MFPFEVTEGLNTYRERKDNEYFENPSFILFSRYKFVNVVLNKKSSIF